MENAVSYNEFLYREREKKHLSKKKFAKFLKIPYLFYIYYENGYVKPSKKYVDKISAALGVDYSIYLEGISSYPTPQKEKDTWFEKIYKKLLGKLGVRIAVLAFLLASVSLTITGFAKYSYVMKDPSSFYSEKYLSFSYAMREKGTATFSLLHEFERVQINERKDNEFVSISASNENFALRSLSAYINYKTDDGNIYYIVSNDIEKVSTSLTVEYTDSANLEKYIGTFNREGKGKPFVLSETITIDGAGVLEKGEIYSKTATKMISHIDDINNEFTSLIKNKLSLEYDFFDELLIDLCEGGAKNYQEEITSLCMGIGGTILTGFFLFLILFSIFFGKRKKKEEKDEVEIVRGEEETIERNLREPKKDIRFFPFIPETVFEIVGIFLVFFGSLRIVNYALMLFTNVSFEQNGFNALSLQLFMYFTVGMFLLYFIDFDIFLNDKRSLRNFFLYGIVFLGLYVVEATLAEYLVKTKGVAQIVDYFYVVPNNFGTISCYFGVMVFLFYEPKWANTKKKMIIYRCLALLPILWILISSLIFQNYRNWGLKLNTWLVYFFDSERPQFSFLCVSYLIGLYFLRLYYKLRYGVKNAERMFNGNRFYFLKNILICVIIAILSLTEYLLRNTGHNIKALGGYWQIIYLVPGLLFYHPHFGRRNKVVDYLTLILYGLFFGIGYLVAGFLIIGFILS